MDYLLALPCTLSKTNSTLILDKATNKKETKVTNNIYTHKIEKDETLVQFLDRIYEGNKPYEMDSCLFTQLAHIYLSNKWTKNITLYVPDMYDPITFWHNNLSYLNLIIPMDNIAVCAMDASYLHTKNLYCLKVGYDQYLSLTDSGVKIMSLKDWTNYIYSSIITFIKINKSKGVIYSCESRMLQSLIQSNKLDVWCLLTLSESIPIYNKVKDSYHFAGIDTPLYKLIHNQQKLPIKFY